MKRIIFGKKLHHIENITKSADIKVPFDMSIEVSLTMKGLSELGFYQDFELKTDDEHDTIRCNRYQISFISPIISKILRNDPTINEFALKTPNSSKCSEIMKSLLNGSPVVVREEHKNIFRSISIELGNEELLSFVDLDLKYENVVEILRNKQKSMFNVEREVEFIASHLYHFMPKDLSVLDLSIIESILSNKSLIVLNEHQLFLLIQELVETFGDEYGVLFSHLRLEFLDHEDISAFISNIDEGNVGRFIKCFYNCLLSLKPIPFLPENNRYLKKSVEFKEDKFDGIFAQLTREAGGNIVTKGIIGMEVTPNCIDSNYYDLVDQEKRKQTNWHCAVCRDEGGSLIFDFKAKRFLLNGYSLKSCAKQRCYMEFFKSWKIEGSNDKETWTIIDEQKSDVLKSYLAEGHWSCKRSDFFRFFRIMMTEKNTCGDFYITLHAIEFFGSLIKP